MRAGSIVKSRFSMLDGLRPTASKESAGSVVFEECETMVSGKRLGDDIMLVTVSTIGEKRLKGWRLAEGGTDFWMPPLAEMRKGAGTDLGANFFTGAA